MLAWVIESLRLSEIHVKRRIKYESVLNVSLTEAQKGREVFEGNTGN